MSLLQSSPSFLKPIHVLTYGTLLGSQFYQSFVAGIVAFRSIPRPQFSSLQAAIFPIYFGLQTALSASLALTYPASSSNESLPSLQGFLAPQNRWSVLVPITTVVITAAVNFVAIGPWTNDIMRKRKHQETRDGKKSYDKGPHSAEMQSLNKEFGKAHGISTLLNLASLVATCWYGVSLASRIN